MLLALERHTRALRSHPPAPHHHRYNTETVSPEVLSRMKQQMTDANSAATHSFLLDDDATLPFSAAGELRNGRGRLGLACRCAAALPWPFKGLLPLHMLLLPRRL